MRSRGTVAALPNLPWAARLRTFVASPYPTRPSSEIPPARGARSGTAVPSITAARSRSPTPRFRTTLCQSSGGFVGVGGAIGNLRTLTVSNSTFTENTAGSGSTYALGGAIYNQGTLRLSGATFSANAAIGLGGAIYSSRTLTLSNSTFSGNDAAGGGALEIVGRNRMVTNCTFAANSAGVGTEISNDRCRSGCGTGRLTLRNTVVDNASGGNCAGIAITDRGNNLDSSGLCGLGPATDPMLDAAGLATNGGPTQTIALEPGSPAINAGNEAMRAVSRREPRSTRFWAPWCRCHKLLHRRVRIQLARTAVESRVGPDRIGRSET